MISVNNRDKFNETRYMLPPMVELRFYHLERQTPEQTVPKLLQQALSRGMRVAFILPNAERIAFYDDYLWRFDPLSFLPHGTDTDPFADQQPVLLSMNPHTKADMALVTEQAELPDITEFQLVCYVFSALIPGDIELARTRWAQHKKHADDFEMTYWRQSADGQWDKQI